MMAANNPNFNPEKYTTIASNHLVVYSIHTLYKDGDEISAEDIISACFMLFPKKFSLRTYPQWPDSALVGRRLHDCEKSGWLTARIETGFKLTAKGIRLAERVAKELGLPVHKKEKPVRKLQVDKVQVAEARPVGELQVDKLQVTEAEKPAPVAKPAHAKPKVEKAKEKRVAEVKVTEVVKAAPAKPKSKKKKEKRVDKLQVTEAVQPVGKLRVAKLQTEEKAKVLVVEAPKTVEKKTTAPVEKPAVIKSKPAKKAKAPIVKAPKPAERKTSTPVAKPAAIKPKPKKKAIAPVVETLKPVKKKAAAPAAKPAPVKPKPAKKAKAPVVKVPKPVKKTAAPIVKPAPVKPKVEKAKVVETPKAKVVPPSAVHRQLSLLPTVSAEEKARAGKFVKMMEGSDAYRLYKKNGANANIGEFDFRSLLLCTMESSHETLARNVELFKGYAGIHNRQDLTAFLGFCAEKFAHLLTPEKKAAKKFK